MKEGKNIEKLFKDGFDDFEVDPGDHLWSKIQNEMPTEGIADASIKGAGTASNAGASWLTTVVVGGAIGLVSVAGYYYFENKAEARKALNESKQRIEEQTNREIKEENTAETREVLEPTSEGDLKIKGNAGLKKRTKEEGAKLSGSTEDASSAEANEGFHTSPNSPSEKGAAQLDAPQETSTKTDAGLNETASEESNLLSKPASQESKTSVIESSSSNNLESSSSSKANAKVSEAINQDSDSPEKNTNENKGANSTNNPMVSPPSNSVDETPGVIEAYKPPNIFTPNGDGNNDAFRVDLEGIEFDEIEVRVYSRSGDLMHSWMGEFGFWDGKTPNGSNAADGPYRYTVIIKKDGKVYPKQGIVMLSRGQ